MDNLFDNKLLILTDKNKVLSCKSFRYHGIFSAVHDNSDMPEVMDIIKLRKTSTKVITNKKSIYLCSPISKQSGEIIGNLLLYSLDKLNMELLPFLETLSKYLFMKYQLYSIKNELNQEFVNATDMYNLSKKQFQILRFISEGKKDKDICNELHISISTLRKHIDNIFQKTQCTNRTALCGEYYKYIICRSLNLKD